MIAAWLLLSALASEPEPIGRMVDVGGRRLRIYCTGSGAPTMRARTATWTER
jgi:hypothetical protein